MSTEKGFSLVEVLIAIAVLGIGLLGVISMQTNSVGGNSLARTITEASTYSSEQLEALLSTLYNAGTLTETGAADGIAGLNNPFPSLPLLPGQTIPDGNYQVAPDTALRPPDLTTTSTDGTYTIYWNIAKNTPIRNVKTVRVLVMATGRGAQRVVPITFIKGS